MCFYDELALNDCVKIDTSLTILLIVLDAYVLETTVNIIMALKLGIEQLWKIIDNWKSRN